MNIQESINKIKELIYMSDGTKVDYIDINHMDLGGEVSVDVFIEAIETLLTAYEKEKEKNKELNKYIEDRAKIGKNIQTFINKDYVEQEYISKDKIKAKIEELEKEIITGAKKTDIIRRAIIYELQSLLEKE